PDAAAARVRPPLVRPREVVLGGVSTALGRHLGARPEVVRILFAAVTLAGGAYAVAAVLLAGNLFAEAIGAAPVLLYLWFWALVPREAGTPDAPRTRRVPVAAVLLGIAGGLALLLPFTWRLDQPVPLGLVESAAAAVLA
ncbi:PspC domain-containing protein, partial [Schumannella sp. 10F1B-5-1]